MVHEKLIKKWYLFVFGLLFTALFIEVILLGDQLEPGIVNAMLFGKKLAQLVWF
jgi:hypothetical protein